MRKLSFLSLLASTAAALLLSSGNASAECPLKKNPRLMIACVTLPTNGKGKTGPADGTTHINWRHDIHIRTGEYPNTGGATQPGSKTITGR